MSSSQNVRWLRSELPGLVRDGVLDDATAERLRARYPAPAGRGIRVQTILAMLGALLVGIGVILFFAANWEVIPRWVRATAVLAAVGAAYGAAWRLRWRPGLHPHLGEAVLLLGALLYGAGIWLIAQIFHISDHQPNGALLWGLGVLPLAWAARSRALAILVLVVASLYVAWNTGETAKPSWAFLLVFPPAATLAYVIRSRAAVTVALLALLVGAASFLGAFAQEHALLFGPAVGALVWLGALAQDEAGAFWRIHAPAWRFVGATGTLLALLPLTFGDLLKEVAWGTLTRETIVAAVVTLVTVGTLAGLLFARRRASAVARAQARAEAAVVIVLGLWSAAATLAGTRYPVAVIIGHNLAMVGVVCALVVASVRRGWAAVQWVAIAGFGVLVLSRYFDLFFDLMPRSLFFIGVGALLIAGVYTASRLRRGVAGGVAHS